MWPTPSARDQQTVRFLDGVRQFSNVSGLIFLVHFPRFWRLAIAAAFFPANHATAYT